MQGYHLLSTCNQRSSPSHPAGKSSHRLSTSYKPCMFKWISRGLWSVLKHVAVQDHYAFCCGGHNHHWENHLYIRHRLLQVEPPCCPSDYVLSSANDVRVATLCLVTCHAWGLRVNWRCWTLGHRLCGSRSKLIRKHLKTASIKALCQTIQLQKTSIQQCTRCRASHQNRMQK